MNVSKQEPKNNLKFFYQYEIKICGRLFHLDIEALKKTVVKIGVSILVSPNELINAECLNLKLFSDKNEEFNCWDSIESGCLNKLDIGRSKFLLAPFVFHSIHEDDNPSLLKIFFQDKTFELFLHDKRYRTNLVLPKIPKHFPSEILKK